MCDVVERIRNEGRDDGVLARQKKIIINLIESNTGSIEQIAAWIKPPIKDVKKIAQKVSVMG